MLDLNGNCNSVKKHTKQNFKSASYFAEKTTLFQAQYPGKNAHKDVTLKTECFPSKDSGNYSSFNYT